MGIKNDYLRTTAPPCLFFRFLAPCNVQGPDAGDNVSPVSWLFSNQFWPSKRRRYDKKRKAAEQSVR